MEVALVIFAIIYAVGLWCTNGMVIEERRKHKNYSGLHHGEILKWGWFWPVLLPYTAVRYYRSWIPPTIRFIWTDILYYPRLLGGAYRDAIFGERKQDASKR